MESRRCRYCNCWEVLPHDRVCSWCGESLFGFDISLEPHVVFAQAAGPALVTLKLRNRGMDALLIDDISCRPSERVSAQEPRPENLRIADETVCFLQVNAENLGVGKIVPVEVSVAARLPDYAPKKETFFISVPPIF